MRSLVVVGLIFAVTPFSSFAQSKIRMPKIEPFGYDGFRLMLQQQGLTNVQLQLASSMQTPEETVVVFLGDLSQAFRIKHELTEFVDRGGALLVATDLGGNRNPVRLPWMYRSTFLAERMRFRAGDLFLAGYEDCPRVTRIAREAAPGLFGGVESLAANRPGYLRTSSEVQAVAWLPRAVGSDRAETLIATAHRGTGRLLLIADHSLLINEMLIHADNARFASNVASWLTENGRRKKLVFCQDNQLLPSWSFTGTPPAIPLKDLVRNVSKYGMAGLPPGDVLLPVLNQSLVDFERKGEFNRLLRQLNGRRYRNSRHLQKPLIVVAALIALLAVYWFITTRKRGLSWQTSGRKKHTAGTPRNRAFAKRNHVVALETLAREFFVELGITRFVEQDNYPRVALAPSEGEKFQTETQIRELWDLANGGAARLGKKLSRKTQTITPLVRNLYELHKQGRLKLE